MKPLYAIANFTVNTRYYDEWEEKWYKQLNWSRLYNSKKAAYEILKDANLFDKGYIVQVNLDPVL